MIRKLVFIAVLYATSVLTVGCLADNNKTVKAEQVNVVIVGSAENPDPVLERVLELERQGIIRNLSVMESFPVQIKFTGPAAIVKELEEIPRKK